MAFPQQVAPIAAGYAYAIRIQITGGALTFPVSGSLRAEVRDYPGASNLAGLLTTDNGTISIVDAETVDLFFSDALTGALARRTCAIDIVRTDITPVQWLGVQVLLPVVTTVTRSPTDIDSPGRLVVDQPVNGLATVSAPPGVTLVLLATSDTGPWNLDQAIAAGALPSGATEAAPMVAMVPPQMIGAALVATTTFAAAVLMISGGPTLQTVVPPPIPTASVVLPPNVSTLPIGTIAPATIASTVAPPATVAAAAPQTVTPPLIASTSTEPPPQLVPAPVAVTPATVGPSSSVFGPTLAAQAATVVVPTTIASTAVVSPPIISLGSTLTIALTAPIASSSIPSPVVAPVSTDGTLDFSQASNSGLLAVLGAIGGVGSGTLQTLSPTLITATTTLPSASVASAAPQSIVAGALTSTSIAAPTVVMQAAQPIAPATITSTVVPAQAVALDPGQNVAPAAIASTATEPSPTVVVQVGAFDFSDPANSGLVAALAL